MTHHLTVGDVLYVDNSILSSVARCSTEAHLRHVLGYTTAEEQATLKAGTAFHVAMESWFTIGKIEDAVLAFATSYQEWAEANVSEDDRLSWSNTSRITRYWLETHPSHALPFTVRPDLVEVGFAHPLTDDGTIMFCGRLDAVARYTDAVYLVEHKSTGRITQTWLQKWRLDSQPTGYIWGARQHLNEPVVGVILNAIEFSRLPTSDRNCTRHAVPYAECGHLHGNTEMIVVTRTDEQLAEWRKTAVHLAQRFRDLLARFPTLDDAHRVRMQGTFNGSCGWCAFNNYCAIGRPASYVQANLRHDPWRPYDLSAAHSAHKP